MKSFVRSVFTCVLACIALSDVRAELPATPPGACFAFVFRSLHATQLVNEALYRHSVLRIQAADSADSQNDGEPSAKKWHKHGHGASDAVITGESYKLDAAQSTNGGVVLFGGTGEINGTVNGDLVLIGSKATFGGTVNGDLVSIGSKLTINSGAVTNGDYVSVASEVKGEQELTTNGERVALNTFSPVVPVFKEALANIFQLRPMSPSSLLSWTLAIVMLIVSLVLGLIFPKVFAGTEIIIRERPGPSFLVGLAVILGGAVLSFLMLITVVGILALPFLALAIFILNIFGCTSVCYWIGKRIAPQLAERSYAVYAWITIGTILIWILYCIPVIGFIAAGLVSLLGLGTFSIYLVDRYRTNTLQPLVLTAPPAHPENPPTILSAPPALPGREPSLVVGPSRAQFLPRLFANLIDLAVLYALLYSLHLTHAIIPLWVFYRFGMFAWRSSTLGQLALNLRVEKPDGSSLVGDYSGALIRALSSLVSLIPLGLGFIWILFHRDLEAWHDKISGTYVVKQRVQVPAGSTGSGERGGG